ncbi:MAG: hypothetical protein AB7T06_33490 [Kofleriaceae bacterium]
MVDGGDAMTDGGGCANPLPSDLVVRRLARVADMNGDAADDILVWGRLASGNGVASAYLILGGQPLQLSCFDRQFTFGASTAIELIDAWVGDITTDAVPDLLLFARDDSPAAEYLVHFYEGTTGGFETTPQVVRASKTNFQSTIGGSLANPTPGYVIAWSGASREVVFGGSEEQIGGFELNTNNVLLDAKTLRQDMGGSQPLGLSGIEDLGVHYGSSPQEIVVVLAGSVQVIRHTGVRDQFETFYDFQATPANLTNSQPKFARFYPESLGNSETLAVAPVEQVGYDVITYDRAGGIVVRLISASSDAAGRTMQDLIFEFVGGEPDMIDLVAMLESNTASELVVYPDVDLDNPTIATPSPVKLTLARGTNALAIGNFDGNAATPEQIVAFSTSPGGTLGACYQYVSASPLPCLKPCGAAATCP